MREKATVIFLVLLPGLLLLGYWHFQPRQVDNDATSVETETKVEDTSTKSGVAPQLDANRNIETGSPIEEMVKPDLLTETIAKMTDNLEKVTPQETIFEPTSEASLTKHIFSVPFTATTGLDTFSAYHLRFDMNFEGTRRGQPTAGNLQGIQEMTQTPGATHWEIEMSGNTFAQLAVPGVIELYDVDNIIYIQNPQDGTWIGTPAALIKSMLPLEMYNPADNIDLPVTAVPQPGEETVNGVLTQRYTFGPEDLNGGGTTYDRVEGTIWVAVDDNTVVKYEATLSGHFDNLVAGGMELMDEGTITMMYEVSDVNGDFTINPPADAKTLDLSNLLSGLDNLNK